jgi:hypothetical protein
MAFIGKQSIFSFQALIPNPGGIRQKGQFFLNPNILSVSFKG